MQSFGGMSPSSWAISILKRRTLSYSLDIELKPKANLTDLLSSGGPISTKLPISSKLKKIFEMHCPNGLQFFQINVVRQGEIYPDYWVTNIYEISNQFIDFSKSIIKITKKSPDFKTTFDSYDLVLDIRNEIEFENAALNAHKNSETLFIDTLYLRQN